jgi:hypothetical protein
MTTTTLHFYNNVARPNENSILIFLQPVAPKDTYMYAAWRVLNPAFHGHQSTLLSNSFSGAVAAVGSPVDDYTDPAPLRLGTHPLLISNPNNQGLRIGGEDPQVNLTPNEVGLENKAETPPTDISILWYVNGSLMVQTNNTSVTALTPGFTATFELQQYVYLMLGPTPIREPSYTVQVFSKTQQFAVPPSATDLYFEVFTDPTTGEDMFKEKSQADYHQAIFNARRILVGR